MCRAFYENLEEVIIATLCCTTNMQVQNLALSSLWQVGMGCRRLEQVLCRAVQKMTPQRRSVLLQCIVLKMLTDCTLMYGACVGVLLKRDGELGAREAGLKTPTKASSTAHTGALFRCAFLDMRSVLSPRPADMPIIYCFSYPVRQHLPSHGLQDGTCTRSRSAWQLALSPPPCACCVPCLLRSSSFPQLNPALLQAHHVCSDGILVSSQRGAAHAC